MPIAIGAAITRQQAQSLAIEEAKKGTGFVSPNPLVGCVVVDAGHRFLASGFHARLGGDHAEVDAFKKIPSDKFKGATVYVTLEPCAHHGRTPPCVDRLLKEPLKAVIVGLEDPNPLVAGKSLARLREKGIEVEVDQAFGEECHRLTEIFLWHMARKTPFVALKMATSLDGQLALSSGESRWITSEGARRRSRELRAKYDATLIGARTLINDNPRLDFRGTEFEGKKENRVVIWDPSGRASEFFPRSEIAKTFPRDRVTILREPAVTEDVLKQLYSDGIYSLFVEGGGFTLSHFVEHRRFNKIYQFVAPCLLGKGKAWSETLSIASMEQRIPLVFTGFERVADEFLITANTI